MYLNRNWFSTYQSIDGVVVLMENGISCQVTGVWYVQVKMYNEIATTLTIVQHLLDLKTNLISLSTLDSLSYKNFAAGGVLRVWKDGGIVILEKLSNGLYVVEGDIVMGDADVSFLVDLDVVDDLFRSF